MKGFDKFLMPQIIVLFLICASSCDKEKKSLLWPAVLNCKVDGISYRDHIPYWLPHGARRTPSLKYSFDKEGKRLHFSSNLVLVNKGESEIGSYTITLNIPLDQPLEANKMYPFEGLPGENHRMPTLYLSQYSERGLPYCNVYANGEMNFNSFGTGKFIVTSIDEKENRVNGQIEFTVPSPAEEDESKLLTFQGQFTEVYLDKD